MRLTVKLVLWLFVSVVLVVGINGYYGVHAALQGYEADVAARHLIMGRVLRAAFSAVMDSDGEARAVSVLEYTDKRFRSVDIRWVEVDQAAEVERRPLVPLSLLRPLISDQVVHQMDGGKMRSYLPLRIGDRRLFALELSESLDGERTVVRHAILHELRAVGGMAFAVAVVAAALGAILVARPVRELVQHARRIGRGDLSHAPTRTARDELSDLGREMNAMCTQLSNAEEAKWRALEQFRHAERLTTVGKLASGLAHELATPLNVITLRAKAIAQGRATGERASVAATSIAEQATRMTNLVRQVLDFARRKSPQRKLVDVNDIVARTTDLVGAAATKANVSVDAKSPAELPKVSGDPSQLQQVFTNLLMNAIQAMPRGGSTNILVEVVSATPPPARGGATAPHVRISVRDEGSGIPAEAFPRIFEPFFTTKDAGEGTGLGLAVCYGIVDDHGGWIDVQTQLGQGSEFSVYLPAD